MYSAYEGGKYSWTSSSVVRRKGRFSFTASQHPTVICMEPGRRYLLAAFDQASGILDVFVHARVEQRELGQLTLSQDIRHQQPDGHGGQQKGQILQGGV